MMEEATRIHSKAYRALAKVFRAMYFYNLTLTFGDIPYSQALKGEIETIYQPEYDTQKEVFLGILKELEEANDSLAASDEVIEGDIIYNGNLTNWRKFINSYRLKVLLTLSHKTGDADFNVIAKFSDIVTNEPIIESNSENGQLAFYDLLDSRYTFYNDSRFASAVYLDSTFVQRLADREDPRLFIYADQTPNGKSEGKAINDFTSYGGGNPIASTADVYATALAGNISLIDQARYTKDPVNEPSIVLGYPEVQFMLAEAVVRNWISGDAKTYYENGVKASFDFYHTYADDYASYVKPEDAEDYLLNDSVNFDNATSADKQIELIITQKYLQSFMQNGWTPYFEHLRTGYPAFLHLPSFPPPTRWMYPQQALDYNKQNVEAAITRQFGANNDTPNQIPWWLK